jgi:hypothetical protein
MSTSDALVAPPLSHDRKQEPLLVWYAAAAISSSASALIFLTALKGIVASDDTAGALSPLIKLFWLGGLLAPLIVAVKGVVLAMVVWGTATLLNATCTYRACLSAIWKAEFLLVLPQFIAGGAAVARGMETKDDLLVPLGLDLFWSPAGPALATASHVVSLPLALWVGLVWLSVRNGIQNAERTRGIAFGVVVAAVAVVLLPVLQLS